MKVLVIDDCASVAAKISNAIHRLAESEIECEPIKEYCIVNTYEKCEDIRAFSKVVKDWERPRQRNNWKAKRKR